MEKTEILARVDHTALKSTATWEDSLGNVELAGCGAQEPLIVAATKRVDA